MRLTAVVVTHNRLPLLKRCIRALLKSNDTNIVVVDMASTDGTLSWLNQLTSGTVHVIAQNSNLGGAAGFAIGMQFAFEQLESDWVVLLDDDAFPSSDALSVFKRTTRDDTAIYCAKVVDADGRLCDMNKPCLNPFWSVKLFYASVWSSLARLPKPYHPNAAELISVDTATFVGFFVPKNVVQTIGYPNSDMFIYSDDILYSLKHRQTSGKLFYDPAIQFIHTCDERTPFDHHSELWRMYYSHRNSLISLRTGAGWLFWLIWFAVVCKWAFDIIKNPKLNAYRVFLYAILHGLTRNTSWSHTRVLALCRHSSRSVAAKTALPNARALKLKSKT